MKALFVSILLFVNSGQASIVELRAQLAGLDTFGSKRISAFLIEQEYGAQLSQLVQASINGDDSYPQIKTQLEAAIKGQYNFADVSASLIRYFSPLSGLYLTIDVVEPADVQARMAFLPAPQGKFDDPDGLMALWGQYLKLSFELQSAGKFEYPKSCPAWHCTNGFEHPRLAPFLEKFDRLALLHEKRLLAILREDARAHFRANAAFALAHLKNGEALVRDLLPAVQDSSSEVRNNVVRVLAEIATKHPDLEIPVEPILQVLNYPTATDRNKAGAVLAGLSLKRENKRAILKSGGRILIAMLKLQQPNNHDYAFIILKNISGKNFGERDYEAWQGWLDQQIPQL